MEEKKTRNLTKAQAIILFGYDGNSRDRERISRV